MDNTILEMRSITKSFPGVNALENVNLKVRQGEIHALVGENGAGKSTLMKVLSGVYPAGSYDGDIFYDGAVRQFKTIEDSEEVGIIIIHQELALVPLSVDCRKHLPGQRGRRQRRDQLAGNVQPHQATPRQGRPRGNSEHARDRHRCRQAAARRDRQGPVEEREASHPR